MNKLQTLLEFQLVDRGDGTILDTKTNLVWQKVTPEQKLTWDEANEYCNNLTLIGNSNWRLPTLDELSSFIEGRNTYLIEEIVKGQKERHWTSTMFVGNEDIMWYVNFYNCFSSGSEKRSRNYVRAVCNNV